VDRLYVIGELAGEASINRAIVSGEQAIEVIAGRLRSATSGSAGSTLPSEVYQVAIIGCGPAGLGAAAAAQAKGLRYLLLERATPASSIRDYPRDKFVESAPIRIQHFGNVLLMKTNNRKEALVSEWERAIKQLELKVSEACEVVGISNVGDVFEIKTATEVLFRSSFVVVAIGVRGSPRRLGVSCETPDRVFYKCTDPDEFKNKRILVVGGGRAGADVAQALADPKRSLGNEVHYSFRDALLSAPSPENIKKIFELQEQQCLILHPATEVAEIKPGKILLKPSHVGGTRAVEEIENDVVFAMLGAVPPAFIKTIGLRTIRRGRPS
jgi:thioredoxin reductase